MPTLWASTKHTSTTTNFGWVWGLGGLEGGGLGGLEGGGLGDLGGCVCVCVSGRVYGCVCRWVCFFSPYSGPIRLSTQGSNDC